MSTTKLGNDVLHLYAQPSYHLGAYISGGRAALIALRGEIDSALRIGIGAVDVFASDGEGYTIYVVAMSDEEAENQPVPYTDDLMRLVTKFAAPEAT